MKVIKPMPSKEKVSVIILAAGSSSRLGQSKQLVKVSGVPLLAKSTKAALDAPYSHIVVVLGANADEHQKTIAHLPVQVIINTDWERGMGSSLKAGVKHVINSYPETNAVVVMVCDQPLITSTHLATFREVYRRTIKPIIASRYNDIIGVPALFDQSLFQALLNIKDTEGARIVIKNHIKEVEPIAWIEGEIDIDTPEDLKLFIAQHL